MIENAPTKTDTIVGITERISYIKDTMYGKVFDVVNVPNPINVAYTALRLALHTDLMYYFTPPGVQLLHCLQPSQVGGENQFVDGFKVSPFLLPSLTLQAAELLRTSNPTAFKTLTTVKATYQKLHKDHQLYYRYPLLTPY
jgi:gamma-butyrobetaine dioxygenase